MNENDAYIFDVENPGSWVFTGEPVWISGWFLTKTGAIFSDIRAIIAGVPHMGILGMPRPEIEKQYRGTTGLPHAGFLLHVQPPLGATDLRIELLDAGHHWVEIWRRPIKVRKGPGRPAHYNPALLPDHLHRLLQARRADPTTSLNQVATKLMLEGAAVPLDTLPNPPFYGALEKPELVGGSQYGKVRVEGWIIHREQRIRRLVASTHPLVENELDYGDRERAEAALLFPDHPYAGRSQYFGMLDLDEFAPSPAVIKLFAELEDGTNHLVFTRRFHVRACPVWERPLPVFQRREFFDSFLALRTAARKLDIGMGGIVAQWRALKSAHNLCRRDAPLVIPTHLSQRDPYLLWQQNNQLTPRLVEVLKDAAHKLGDAPVFTVLVDTSNCTQAHIDSLSLSLLAQIYPHWEAHFVGSADPTGSDARYRKHSVKRPATITSGLNSVIETSRGTHLIFLPGHSQLSPDALLVIAERIAAQSDLDLIYTDEDRMNADGRRSDPDFKPDWSPAFALSGLFPGQLSVIRRELAQALGGLRESFAYVGWHDLLLRISDGLESDKVAHVPLVCHHACAEIPRELDLNHPAYEQARQALAEAVKRRGWPASPFLPEAGNSRRQCFHQLRWDRDLLARLPVTIVIPTRDRLHLLQECVERLEETVVWDHVCLVIVDDHSRDPDALRYLEQIQLRTDLHCTVVRSADPHAPFNYSQLVNAALPQLKTPLVLHLNNDVNALEPGWLEEMVAWFTQADIGVVGAKLIFPDRSLNHTGIVIGPHGGLADTPWARLPEKEIPPSWHAVTREVSAVTGACLMTRTDLYRQLGGFDEGDFGVAYNDVDYCLRVRGAGQRVIYTPQARLMHWGSATRGVTFDDKEHIAWLRRYAGYADPYFKSNLLLKGNRVQCRPEGGARPERVGRMRVLLITHNLNLEGAPLFLLEYATHLARVEGFKLDVLAGQEGPLRSAYEALGAQLTLINPGLLMRAPDRDTYYHELGEISTLVDWEQTDLVVANTLLSFWGVLLAKSVGCPSLFYIHESSSVFRAFENSLALELHVLVHEALQSATRTHFLCTATQDYYADDDRGNFRIVPSWIGISEIEAFRSEHTRAAMRIKHGLVQDEVVIANIGTVCERKGLHIYIRAIQQFNRRYRGEKPVRFLMVGAREGIYLDLLKRDIKRLGLENVTLVPETREVFDFFVASDMFVCTSYEESFPRVVMEAMAFGTPIVSTDVHGIPELIGQRQDGYLVKPGDVEGLATMMLTCLAKERSGKSLAPTANSKVRRYHDAALILPQHANLARAAMLVGA